MLFRDHDELKRFLRSCERDYTEHNLDRKTVINVLRKEYLDKGVRSFIPSVVLQQAIIITDPDYMRALNNSLDIPFRYVSAAA